MSYSICLIDDSIPVKQVPEFDDTQIISRSMLNYLLKEEIEWDEDEVKKLISDLIGNKSITSISAFNDPNFFFNHNSETSYVPEVFIYDWNYKGLSPEQSEDLLKRILEETFTLVFIYTGEDQKHEVDKMIEGEEFQKYRNRIYVSHKEDGDSVDSLIKSLDKKNKENFSFKFVKNIRKVSNEIINEILNDLGSASVNQIGHFLSLDNDEEDHSDFLNVIAERYRNLLPVSDELNNFEFNITTEPEEVEKLGPQIWSHRLYNYSSVNSRVRMGDIVEIDDGLNLIVSADCDLNMHWHKNFGYISIVPLHKIHKDNEYLKTQLQLTRTANQLKKGFYLSSFSNNIDPLPAGQHMLPFLNVDGVYSNFVLFSKELFSKKINVPELPKQKPLKREYLKYGDVFECKKIASISEPYLSAIIQNIIRSLSGFGTPNVPSSIHELIAADFKKMLS